MSLESRLPAASAIKYAEVGTGCLHLHVPLTLSAASSASALIRTVHQSGDFTVAVYVVFTPGLSMLEIRISGRTKLQRKVSDKARSYIKAVITFITGTSFHSYHGSMLRACIAWD